MKFNNDNDYCFNIAKKKTKVKGDLRFLFCSQVIRLHLHLTDNEGWRIQIEKYPNLTEYGAWRMGNTWKEFNDSGRKFVRQGTAGAYGGYYSKDDVRELVAYAKERNITIIPEIEMPGHGRHCLSSAAGMYP